MTEDQKQTDAIEKHPDTEAPRHDGGFRAPYESQSTRKWPG